MKSTYQLNKEDAVLLVIDLQERLMPAMYDRDFPAKTGKRVAQRRQGIQSSRRHDGAVSERTRAHGRFALVIN